MLINRKIQAKLYGEELLNQGVQISHLYCSPALRSIETADKILEGKESDTLIC
jgi:broad specificity phosphatase PhoE